MKKKIIGLVAVLGLSATLMGCEDTDKEGNRYNNVSKQETVTSNYQTIIDGSLYYIPHKSREKDLPTYYAQFLKDHPELRVVAVESDVNEGQYNSIYGYFIFTEKK